MTAAEQTNNRSTTESGFLRERVRNLPAYEPGKSIDELARERGLHQIVKLASNEGPWGPLPQARAAIEAAITGLNRYPDSISLYLRRELAELHKIDIDRLAIGNGADALVNEICRATLDPGDEAVFGWPSFPTYLLGALKVGATPVRVPLRDDRYDLNSMLEHVSERTRLIFVCNPNNPTGTMVTRAELTAFLDALPKRVLCVIDEAYWDYVQADVYPDAIAEFVGQRSNVCALRTFSKVYGLAGLRIGYLAGPPELVTSLRVVRGPFEVSALAQAAALASLRERGLLAERVEQTRRGRRHLFETLQDLGTTPVPSVANFVCVRVGQSGRGLYDRMLSRGVIIRPLNAFGLDDAVRITVGTPSEMQTALSALTRELASD